MAKNKKELIEKVGPWAFILGLVLAAVTGAFIQPSTGILLFLGLLGLVVGLLNVKDQEVNTYLIASIAFLVTAASLREILVEIFTPIAPWVATKVASFFSNIVIFISPGASVVALKALYSLARD